MTRSAIQTLTELTYLYATMSLANDLVAFSVHANRRTITPDDVLLVARKNEELLTKLKDYASSTNILPVAAPTVSKSSSKALRPKTSLATSTASKNSPPQRRRHSASLSLSSSSSSSSPPPKTTTMTLSRHHRELRQRMLNGTDSERSSDDEDSVPLIPPSKKQNKNISAKRKYIDSSDDDDDDDAPPLVTKGNNQLAIASKSRPMDDVEAQLSSGEDSMDF